MESHDQHGGGNSNRRDHPQQQQQQQPSLRGLSPTSVMSGGKSSSRDSSRSPDRTTAIHRNETMDDRDENEHEHVCGSWPPGLVRWRRGRRIREPRTPPTETFISTTTEPPSWSLVPMTRVSLFCGGTAMAILMIHFSLLLPFTLSPAASQQTYVWAQWTYQHQLSHFDNTILTYGTDYFLAACMMTLIHMIPNCSFLFDTTAYYTRGLLGSYMISVLAGGWAHQTVTTIGQQNTTAFRVTWTICVGAVAMASFYMGAAASSLRQYDTTSKQQLRLLQQQNCTSSASEATSTAWSLDRFVPIIPVSFWFVYAAGISYMVVIGGFSFQRPACDIFVVGITQFPSTFYMMLVLYGFGVSDGEHSHGPNRLGNVDRRKGDAPASKSADEVAIVPVVRLSNRMKYLACCGFILNAPLLPLYPILVQYTTWSLGCINTLLHTWLLIAWTCQGMSLRQIGVQMIRQEQQLPPSSQ